MMKILVKARRGFKIRATLPVIAIAVCGFGAARQTFPPQKSKDAWPDMPTYDIFTKEELTRDFVTMRLAKPLDKPELGFSVTAPTSWDEVPLTISKEEAAKDDEGMVSLALLKGKNAGVRIEVAYCRVPPSIDFEKWARACTSMATASSSCTTRSVSSRVAASSTRSCRCRDT